MALALSPMFEKHRPYMGVSEKLGVPYSGGPYNKDPTI